MSAISVTGWYSALLCLLSCAGCAELLDLPSGPYVAGPFPCLAEPKRTPVPLEATARVEVQACNFSRPNCFEPATGLTAVLCDEQDIACLRPLPTAPGAQTWINDDKGKLTFQVPTGAPIGIGFTGYLRILSGRTFCTDESTFGPGAAMRVCPTLPSCNPSDQSSNDCQLAKFLPALFVFTPPVTDALSINPLQLVPTGYIPPVLEASGIKDFTWNDDEGIVFATAVDCTGRPASGVTFSLKDGQKARYLVYQVKGGADATATETGPTGVAGFLGLPPGSADVVATFRDVDGEVQKLATVRVPIQPGTITYVNVGPSSL